MRFYIQQHSFYCGIDLHARTMYVCILSREGKSVLERNIPTRPEKKTSPKSLEPCTGGFRASFFHPALPFGRSSGRRRRNRGIGDIRHG